MSCTFLSSSFKDSFFSIKDQFLPISKNLAIPPTEISSKKIKKNKNTEQSGSTKKYSQISIKKRKQLIQKVMNQKFTIKEAAEEVGIKCSSAKAILKVFKNEGRIGKKQFRQKKNKVQQQFEKKVSKNYHHKEIVVNVNNNFDFQQTLSIFNEITNEQNLIGYCGSRNLHSEKIIKQLLPDSLLSLLNYTNKQNEENNNQIDHDFKQPIISQINPQLQSLQSQQQTQITSQAIKEFYENLLMRNVITNFLSQIEGSTNMTQKVLLNMIEQSQSSEKI